MNYFSNCLTQYQLSYFGNKGFILLGKEEERMRGWVMFYATWHSIYFLNLTIFHLPSLKLDKKNVT